MKPKFRILFFVLMFSASKGYSQFTPQKKHIIDSLQAELKLVKTDTIKARINFLLCSQYSDEDSVKAKNYLSTGRRLSKNSSYLQAISFFYEGRIYETINLDKGNQSYLTAIKLLSKLDTKEARFFKGMTLFNYSINLYNQDKMTEVVDVLLNKAIPIAIKNIDDDLLSKSYVMVAKTFKNLEQFDKAVNYFEKGAEVLEKSQPNSNILLECYTGAAISSCYLSKFDKVKILIDKAKPLTKLFPGGREVLRYHEVETIYFMDGLKDNTRAMAAAQKGYVLAKKIDNPFSIVIFRFLQYKILVLQKRYDKAVVILNELANDKQFMEDALNRQSIYKENSYTYKAMGNKTKAYDWLERYAKITDSLNHTKTQQEINELEVKFRNAENQQKITKLETEKRQNLLERKNSRLLSWILAGTCVMFAAIALNFYLVYKSRKKESQFKEELLNQKIIEAEQQKQIDVSKALLKGGEEERTRLARDLHDGLGGMLASVKFNLASVHSRSNENEITNILEQLDNSIAELRRISKSMMPESLQKLGLQEAINDLCHSISKPGFKIDYQSFDISSNLSQSIQINIYRIIQEIFSNAIKHSNATNLLLQCSQNDDMFFITAEDNGKGFDLKDSENFNGSGLKNIKNRVEFLKGTFEINTAPNQGTTFNISVNVLA